MTTEPDSTDPHDVAADDQAARVLEEADVPAGSPAAGVVDEDLADPPEPSEPG
jgi:hypothetical protein